MKIIRNIKVPTGNILIGETGRGKVEFLSIGDYGKKVNLKCNAMGLDRELNKVEHTKMLPLTEKWVITISSQYGCSMKCTFCDVPKVGPGRNVNKKDLIEQVMQAMNLHPHVISGERLNIHFARMGEPTYNPDVIEAAHWFNRHMPNWPVHSVVSTMMPKHNKNLYNFLKDWMLFKNNTCHGEAGLQLSINSTHFEEREKMFGGYAWDLGGIHAIMYDLPKPRGRKITLNFAVADYTINPEQLLRYFTPDHYIIKLTPMHKTASCMVNEIKTPGDYTSYYSYKEHEENLTKAGYDVLVFIASEYEDLGRITCGNAILSGTEPLCPHEEVI